MENEGEWLYGRTQEHPGCMQFDRSPIFTQMCRFDENEMEETKYKEQGWSKTKILSRRQRQFQFSQTSKSKSKIKERLCPASAQGILVFQKSM